MLSLVRNICTYSHNSIPLHPVQHFIGRKHYSSWFPRNPFGTETFFSFLLIFLIKQMSNCIAVTATLFTWELLANDLTVRHLSEPFPITHPETWHSSDEVSLLVLCAGQNELGCVMNGRKLEEGQVFQPSCAQLCHCLGGGVTCVPLCSNDLQRPADNCPNPQLVRPPGRCCREWVCDGQDNSISSNPSAGDGVDLQGQSKMAGNTFQHISLLLVYQSKDCSNKSGCSESLKN